MNEVADKKCLLHWGGWEGHRPDEYKDVVSPWLETWGFAVEISNDLERFADREALAGFDLIFPLWTLGNLTKEQEDGLTGAVAGGVGLGGIHGMCGAFTDSLAYKWMTGGQLVAHPKDCEASYTVEIADHGHPITEGLADFRMENTEQYYMHVDPRIDVLATTTFGNGSVNPVVWTNEWEKGRVFYFSVGHYPHDFDVPEAREILRRGLSWASR